MTCSSLALGCAAVLLPAGVIFAQPPGTLQGGTYNAPAGTGAYDPASPSPFGLPSYPSQPVYPGLPPSPRQILNSDILNPGGWNFAAPLMPHGQEAARAKAEPGRETSSLITVTVPAPDAELWVNGKPTRQRGLRRVFVSPPLEPGTYRYVFRVTWPVNGRRRSAEQPVTFQPGADRVIDFTAKR